MEVVKENRWLVGFLMEQVWLAAFYSMNGTLNQPDLDRFVRMVIEFPSQPRLGTASKMRPR